MVGRRLMGAVAVALIAATCPTVASAATIRVSTTADVRANDGRCSLREAVGAANGDVRSGPAAGECPAGAGQDTISVPAGRFQIATGVIDDNNVAGDFDISGFVTIDGAGAAQTTLDGAGRDRVLDIASGSNVTVQQVTITGGRAPAGAAGANATAANASSGAAGGTGTGGVGDVGANGGGIRNHGTLAVSSVAIVGNAAGAGGRGGNGTGGRGGDAASGGGAGGTGGTGIGGEGGEGGEGGGIWSSGSLTISASTLSDNRAGNGGVGGVGSGGAGATGGTAPSGGNGGTGGTGQGGDGGAGGHGAGIHSSGGVLTVATTTIARNRAGEAGLAGAGSGGDGGTGGAGIGPAGNGGTGGTGGSGIGGLGRPGGNGGGVHRSVGAQTFTNVTLSGNRAGDGGDSGDATGGRGGTGGGSIAGASGGAGGTGGAALGGAGAPGGTGGGGTVADATFLHATVASNATGAPGAGGSATGGNGGNAGLMAAARRGVSVPGATPPTPATGGGLVGDADLRNTIVASNTPGNCAVGPFTDLGRTISFPDTSCPGTNGDPKLGDLAANGGLGETMRLRPGSAALDKVPSTGAGCTATDQRGVPRPTGAACDVGAYEVAPPVAVTGAVTRLRSTSATLRGSVTPRQRVARVRFEYGRTASYGRSTPARDAGAGASTSNVSHTLRGLRPRTTYHYRLVATTADGTSFGADRTFTTRRNPAPVIRSASLTRRVFAIGSGRTPRSAAAKRGTRIRWRLSERATLRITVQRRKRGRWRTAMTFSRKAKAGRGSTRFTGRVGGRKLGAGRHRFRLVAKDALGKRSRARNLRFRVVKRRSR